MNFTRRTTTVAVATTAALGLVSGVACAYWTANGSGVAAAQAGRPTTND